MHVSYSYVDMASLADVEKALTFNHTMLGSRCVMVVMEVVCVMVVCVIVVYVMMVCVSVLITESKDCDYVIIFFRCLSLVI